MHKAVPFRYCGKDLLFYLSQALFSSFDVDTGTRLLLKNLADFTLPNRGRILDTGCGVGILGCCLAKKNPSLDVEFSDRDALALAFTRLNLKENGISGGVVSPGLLLPEDITKTYDLIVSNLPAKAGEPVLKDFFRRCPAFLSEKGAVAIVIVEPLKEPIANCLRDCGHKIILEDHSRRHSVYIFHPEGRRADVSDPGLTPYIRHRGKFGSGNYSYNLATVYGIPGFDTPGYDTTLAMELITGRNFSGNTVVFNPGQGHVPLYIIAGNPSGLKNLVVSGRDLLALSITARNVRKQGIAPRAHHIPSIQHLLEHEQTDTAGALVVLLDSAGVNVEPEAVIETASRLLSPSGILLVTGKSTDIARLDRVSSPFNIMASKKHRGFRAVLYKRRRA